MVVVVVLLRSKKKNQEATGLSPSSTSALPKCWQPAAEGEMGSAIYTAVLHVLSLAAL